MAAARTRPLVIAAVIMAVAMVSTGGGVRADDPYQVLEAHGLPRGVLPLGAVDYHLDPVSGQFDVTLPSQCDVTAGSRTVRYEASVSGTINNDTLSDLNGVAVDFVFWIPISSVRKDGADLIFTAGPARESFPIRPRRADPPRSDLEERERAFAAGGGPYVDPDELARREDKRKAADIDRELSELKARKNSRISGSASTSAHGDKKGGTRENGVKTDKGNYLKVSWEGGADYYTAAKLEDIFKQFGKVEDIVIKTKKSRNRGSAIVVMASKEAAKTALKNHSVYNVFPVPLMVAPVEESGPAFATPPSEPPRAINIDGTGFVDMEASVFRKLQEAHKRKQCG
ncbi:uncharacterized protein LOC124657815 [Lolium rigidum]|uniref:uncharacterized protein LOC124657797 n=1 Tax=Lolium rigidum TaxID=89674 RepID=UPI001F5CAB76|nr:uncharacterized protein LOC124657797 [Lolium rigidum]XP_047052270.1 uncharacterized protein LOC124657815 [Lolium rigidum]